MRLASRIAASLLSLALGSLAGPTAGETIRVRSGEHGDFSRLVFDLARPTEWRLGRTEEGYGLRLAGSDIAFDTDRVFRMIPRSRISDLTVGDDGTLALHLGCRCHASAFVTGDGALVVDVADGEAPAGSPFEQSLGGIRPDRPERQEAGSVNPHPEIEPRAPQPRSTVELPLSPPVREDPRLAFFWRGAAADRTRPAIELRPQEGRSRDALHETPPHGADNAGEAAGDETQASSALRDSRVAEAQTELLRQLSRAASQGLLEVELETQRQPNTPSALPEEPLPAEDATGPDEPAMHVETSIDRDMLSTLTRPPATADGERCLPDASFDLPHWGDERPVAVQIAERRGPLVGEFDRAEPEAVLNLARLYLFLGFGAEARAVLGAFDGRMEDMAAIAAMSAILDERQPDAGSPLFAMTGCDSAAAMWAVLAWPELPAAAEVDEAAVLRTFSALPIHLRRHLGPGLSRRLLDRGRDGAARAVRDAIARAPGDAGAALRLVEAGIDGASGDADHAERRLDALARSNDPLAVDALILAIRSRLDRDAPVPRDLAESAEALAFEQQDGPQGPLLYQLHILARASAGDLDHAFDSLRRWVQAETSDLQRETAERLFLQLAGVEDETSFLTLYFANRDLVEGAGPDADLRIALASPLADAGFGDEVSRLLHGEAALSRDGRVLRARVALAAFDPATALTELEGLDDEDAARARASAFAMTGNHRAAASVLAELGETEEAGRAAWRGGDWPRAAQSARDDMREAISAFDLVPQTSPEPTAAPGPLAQAREFLQGSRDMRATLDALLQATAAAD